MIEPGLADRGDDAWRERPRQIDAGNLGAERIGEFCDFERATIVARPI